MLETIAQAHNAVENYLILSAILFSGGLFAAVARRSAVGMVAGVLLMLNAGALNFAAFGRFRTGDAGWAAALMVVVIAAAQTAVLLALILAAYRTHRTADADEMDELHW